MPYWASKKHDKARVKFKGGERSLLGLKSESRDEDKGGLRDELKQRALKKGFMELSGGRNVITVGSLRVAMAKKGGGGGEDDDLALRRFIESRGGTLREGLSFEQFRHAYEEGRGSVAGGSLSLPFVDGGGESTSRVELEEKAKKSKRRERKEKKNKGKGRRRGRHEDGSESGESDSDSDSDSDSSYTGGHKGGKSGKDLDPEIEDMVVDPYTEEAILKTFSMYDLNQDGVVSYLELKTVFQQQGRDASDYEIRAWIRARDSSGTGSVDFGDFRRAYLTKLRGK